MGSKVRVRARVRVRVMDSKLQVRPTRKTSKHEKKTRTSSTNEHHKQTTKMIRLILRVQAFALFAAT